VGDSFKDLVVWQRAVQLSLAVYKLTAGYPDSERFGLTNQLRRASVSIASNIAEGYGRSTRGEYLLFLGHARGSNCELQTQLVIAEGLAFGTASARQATAGLSEEVESHAGCDHEQTSEEALASVFLFPGPCFPGPWSLFPWSLVPVSLVPSSLESKQ
jgi:four helix bundle protein